jgi:alkylation response protein AidB-like acyl-CoA dehydrogenase
VQLTAEQTDFVAAIRDFAHRECGTREQRAALSANGHGSHNPGLYRRLADLGWVGACVPEEYGGAGAGIVELCLFLEETAYAMMPIHGAPSTLTCVFPYERFGSEAQKQEVLRGVVAGAVEAIGMSEPAAGSDVGALSCRAQRTDDGYVINGQKTWVSNAHIADHVLVICRTGTGERKHDGLSMLMVPSGTPGMEITGIDTMGGRDVNDVFFTDCVIPEENLIGEAGRAWPQLTAGLNHERLVIAAECLGSARRAFDDALGYVKERRQFGRPVGSFQALRHRLADLATEIACCRLLVYDVASRAAAEPDRVLAREASMAKLKASELARRTALDGLQMMGGYGYATEYEMEHQVRRAIITTVYGGTSEIQRDIIGRTFGL